MLHITWILFCLIFSALALSSVKVGADESRTQEGWWQLAQARWDDDADRTFWLGQGMGRQLMTQEQWREHQEKMRGMSMEEKNRYREEWHNKLMQQAQKKGMKMPNTPNPHRGSGMGQGMGLGNGRGGGMGRGGPR